MHNVHIKFLLGLAMLMTISACGGGGGGEGGPLQVHHPAVQLRVRLA